MINSNDRVRKMYEYLLTKYVASASLKICIFTMLLIIFFMNIYNLNLHTVYVADDYGFRATAETITSPRDFLAVLYQRYFGWTGRMIAEAGTYLFLLMPKSVFNIVNSFGYVFLVLLIYSNIVVKREIHISLLIFINFFLYMFLPVFGQDILWISGSANYLWTTDVALVYTLLWRCYSQKLYALYNNQLFMIFSFMLGILAGMTNENTSIALFIMSLFFIIYYKKLDNKIYSFSIYAIVGELLGTILLLAAPGNFVRASTTEHIKIFTHLHTNFDQLFNPECLLISFTIFCIFYIVLKNKNKLVASIFAITSITAALSLTPSPASFTGRIVLSGLAFMMIAAGILYIQIDFTKYKVRKIICLLSIFVFMGSFSIWHSAKADVLDYEDNYNDNLQVAAKEKAIGSKNIIVNAISPKSRFCASYGLGEVKPDSKDEINIAVAKYLDVNTIESAHVKETDTNGSVK